MDGAEAEEADWMFTAQMHEMYMPRASCKGQLGSIQYV